MHVNTHSLSYTPGGGGNMGKMIILKLRSLLPKDWLSWYQSMLCKLPKKKSHQQPHIAIKPEDSKDS